jgi:hypothetical protein
LEQLSVGELFKESSAREPMPKQSDVRVGVRYPTGVSATGAAVAIAMEATNPVWTHVGVIGPTGEITADLRRIPWDAKVLIVRASIEDEAGVRWGNGARVKLDDSSVRYVVTLYLARLHHELPQRWVAAPVKLSLAGSAHGKLLLEDLEEAVNSLQCGLPSAGAAIAGRAVHGALRLRGELDGWWSPDWNGSTLGTLLSKDGPPAILHAISTTPALGSGFVARLRASVLMRNMAVHQHWTRLTVTEATVGWIILSELVNAWFEPGAPATRAL